MNDLLETWLPNVSMISAEVWDATYETLYMVIVGAVIGTRSALCSVCCCCLPDAAGSRRT